MTKNNLPDLGNSKINPDWMIALVRSVWYPELTGAMTDDAQRSLIASGLPEKNIRIIDAPGSFEIPLLCQQALQSGADGVIAFGIIVQGATHHAALVAEQSAAGCMQVQLSLGKPVIYEVLFVDTLEDAKARALGPDAKGPIAAATLLSQLANLHEMRS